MLLRLRVVLSNCSLVLQSIGLSTKMPFYAVAKGRASGIFMTWPDCEAQVKGFSGARYKKFDSIDQAQDFIKTHGGISGPPKINEVSKKSESKINSNLKRSYSTSTFNQNKNNNYSNQSSSKSSNKPNYDSFDDSDEFPEDSDDLNTMLIKQMDDIEKRLKGFEKGVDKIVKNSTGSSGKSSSNRKSVLIEPPKPKKRKTGKSGFEEDEDGFVQVYTDGACSANGKTSAKAGLGVFWGPDHPLNVSEPVSGRATNNCGEIQAATRAIKQALDNRVQKLTINTDSQFLINSVTKWIPGWKRKGWKVKSGEPVKNEKDFKDLDSVQHKLNIKWNYVEAHRGVFGNEMADQLAKAGATLYNK